MIHLIRKMTPLLVVTSCTLTLGAMSGTANANMCMKKPYGYHGYMKPVPAYGMRGYPQPMMSYGRHGAGPGGYASAAEPSGHAGKPRREKSARTASVEPLRPAPGPDIVETAAAAGEFDTLIKAVVAADLYDTLRGAGPVTVFAPTDAAFEKLPSGQLEKLMADKEKLASVLKYHVVPGRVTAADILQQRELKTVQGQTLSLDTLSVVSADIETSNGIVHVIDRVLIPDL